MNVFYSSFSFYSLFKVSRDMRKRPVTVGLTPHLRRRLEQEVLDGHAGGELLEERILLRRQQDATLLSDALSLIRSSICPHCAGHGDLLTYEVRRVRSSRFGHRREDRTELACRPCARRRTVMATLSTLMAGWWSLGGLRNTPYAVYRNLLTLGKELYAAELRRIARTGLRQYLRARRRLSGMWGRLTSPADLAPAPHSCGAEIEYLPPIAG